MSAHTPGPWSVKKFRTSVDDHEVIGADGKVICIGPYDRPLDDQERIDFRLIAAAPDLLDAARLAMQIAESWIHDQLDGTSSLDSALRNLDPVRAAIAKAIGDTK